MFEKIHKLLGAKCRGYIELKGINWKKIRYQLLQFVAIIPRLIALPFFIFAILLVIVAIPPGWLADKLQRLADKVLR